MYDASACAIPKVITGKGCSCMKKFANLNGNLFEESKVSSAKGLQAAGIQI